MSILSLGFAFTVGAKAQDAPSIAWQSCFGGSYTEVPKSIQPTADGGYVVAGSSTSTGGQVGLNYGGKDCWVVKMDAAGVLEWSKVLGGSSNDEAFSAEQTSDGGYIMCGLTGSSDHDVTENHGLFDAWMVKLDASGEMEWQRTLGGGNIEGESRIRQTSDGGYIMISGSFSSDGDLTQNHGAKDLWVVKMDGSGTIEWQRSYGGGDHDGGSWILELTEGGYLAIGTTYSNNGDVSGNHGVCDVWILKLGEDGTIEWQKAYGGNGYEGGISIATTNDGGYIFTGGALSSTGDVSGHHGEGDFWVVKITAGGVLEWQRCLGGSGPDYGEAVFQTPDGGYLAAGKTFSTDGDVTYLHNGSDIWVVKLNPTGELQWQKPMGSNSDDWGYGALQASDGGYVITGNAGGNGGDVSGGHGNDEFWVVKLNAEDVGLSEAPLHALQIIPNPTTGIVRLANDVRGVHSILVSDVIGNLVLTLQFTSTIDLGSLADGVYTFELLDGAGVSLGNGRILKQEL